MFIERTRVGFNAHSPSNVAAAIDAVTGGVVHERLVPDPEVGHGHGGVVTLILTVKVVGPNG